MARTKQNKSTEIKKKNRDLGFKKREARKQNHRVSLLERKRSGLVKRFHDVLEEQKLEREQNSAAKIFALRGAIQKWENLVSYETEKLRELRQQVVSFGVNPQSEIEELEQKQDELEIRFKELLDQKQVEEERNPSAKLLPLRKEMQMWESVV